MGNIITVTVNPAIDVATTVDHVRPGPKLKCGLSRVDPGGGGINVARSVVKLGGTAKALFAVGGSSGDQLIAMVRKEGVAPIPVTVTGQTRQNLAVTDEHSGEQYRFSLRGDEWTRADVTAMLTHIKSAAQPNGFIVLSGGLAPGMPSDFHGQVQSELAGITDKVIIDTCNPALAQIVAKPRAALYALRLDQREASMAAGRDLVTLNDNFAFSADLIQRGVARIVIIGRGSEGSLMMSQDKRFFCHSAKVTVRSKIGAGDAFVGGLVLSLSRNKPLDQALQWGVAAASATVGTEGTALCTLQSVEALLPQCWVEVCDP